MAQRKNEFGLTPQQERFCHEVIKGEYSADGKGVYITAYRKAYNCKSEDGNATKTQYENASRLANDSKIAARIAQLEAERNALLRLSHTEYISQDIWLNDLDVLELMIFDKKLHAWRLRKVYEMSKEIRKKVPFTLDSKGRMIPDLNKNVVRERLMKALGIASERKDIGISVADGVRVIDFGEFPDNLEDVKSDKM